MIGYCMRCLLMWDEPIPAKCECGAYTSTKSDPDDIEEIIDLIQEEIEEDERRKTEENPRGLRPGDLA